MAITFLTNDDDEVMCVMPVFILFPDLLYGCYLLTCACVYVSCLVRRLIDCRYDLKQGKQELARLLVLDADD